MAKPAELEGLPAIASRFGGFVAERHPFALAVALEAFEAACGGPDPNGEPAIDALRPALGRELARRLGKTPAPPGLPGTTPRTSAERPNRQARPWPARESPRFPRRRP